MLRSVPAMAFGALAWSFALSAAVVARGDDAGSAAPPAVATQTTARLSCAAIEAPGRVRCFAEAEVGEGESIRWGDVALLAAPPFVVALRGRIGPHDATERAPRKWRWEFAVVARAKGEGWLEGRVRLVVCRGEVCGAREAGVRGRLEVGRGARLRGPGE